MKIELTKKQVEILYKLVIQSNWNGQILDQAKELRDLLGREIEKELEKNKVGEKSKENKKT